MSGGGAQSALLGVTGDSSLYDDYLAAIGAVEGVSDAVLGSQAWCPVTSLDSADEAYEWMMGNTRTDRSEEEQTISDELTTAYAAYINQLGLTDENGEPLTLEASADGRYQAGSYYDYMKEIIEESLNNFLADTSFPYDADAASSHGGPGAGGMAPRDGMGLGGPQGGPQDAAGGQGERTPGNGMAGAADGKTSPGDSAVGGAGGQDERAPGNGVAPGGDGAEAGGIGAQTDFAAIDQIQRKESSTGVKISGTYETAQDYISALNADGTWVNYDAATGTATITSIADFAAAVKTASKGIAAFDQLDASQGDTAVNTEANLALALKNYGASVDYSFVWGQKHTTAERSGDATTTHLRNFVMGSDPINCRGVMMLRSAALAKTAYDGPSLGFTGEEIMVQ